MATKDEEAPVDTRDALEVLESEAKEWDKVCQLCGIFIAYTVTDDAIRMLKSTVFLKPSGSTRMLPSSHYHPASLPGGNH
jgi:DnaJ family protein C protein 8